MPTREDVLAIRTIEEAFNLCTPRVTKREIALIRAASRANLLIFTQHASTEADDEMIPLPSIRHLIRHARATSKDTDPAQDRAIGINFEGSLSDHRRVRAKV